MQYTLKHYLFKFDTTVVEKQILATEKLDCEPLYHSGLSMFPNYLYSEHSISNQLWS